MKMTVITKYDQKLIIYDSSVHKLLLMALALKPKSIVVN